jgi:4'-phosphopantetheinyl transferase
MDAPDVQPGERLVRLNMNREGQPIRAWVAAVPSSAYAALRVRSRGWLHPSERAALASLTAEPRRMSYLLGRYAAKRAASHYLGTDALAEIEVANGVFQQPVLRFPAWDIPHVTLCHTDRLALAVAHSPDHVLGIDAEPLDPARAPVLRPLLSDAEQAPLAAMGFPEAERLFLLWTAREALSKALRCGLTVPWDLLETAAPAAVGHGEVRCTFARFPQYQARCAMVSGHAMALVLPKDTHLGDSLRGFVEGVG